MPANALATILSGDIGIAGNAADNSYSVISNPPGLTNSAVLDGFLITGGTGINESGGMYNNGRGDYSSTSSSGIVCSPTVRNCSFQGNSSINGAGAMLNDGRNYGASSPVLINCSFQNNSTTNGGGAMTNNGSDGGTSSPVMTNCSFLNNSSRSSAGAIYSEGYSGTSNSVMTNCIVFGNKGNGGRVGSSIYTSGARISATYSLFETGIFGYSDGGNNRTTAVSPFVSATDTRLNACSPAIDAGNNAANTTATDLAGNPRRYNQGQIDMGAYEYQGTPSQPLTLTNPSQSATTVCAGDLVRFGVTPAGTGPFNATLYRDNAEVVRYIQFPEGLEIRSTSVSTQSGTYQFVVTSACNSVTTTYAPITVNPLPTQYAVTGGGAFCQGGAGVVVGLSGSQTGVNYQLQRDGNPVGSPVAGTGSALDFGNQTTAGTYTVLATNASTSCQQAMSGSASVTVTPQPSAPMVVTQSGYAYSAGVSNLTIAQNVGPVSLTVLGCSEGMVMANGNAASSFTVSTAMTGTQTYTATCTLNGCTSPVGSFQLTVVPTTLSVLHRDADYGNTQNNIIKPYLQLANAGGQAIPYGEVTVRYWFTSEGQAPPTNLAVYYA
ncbi:choice-of-anchor Q domain-containing protein [Spirosoma lituiforme]